MAPENGGVLRRWRREWCWVLTFSPKVFVVRRNQAKSMHEAAVDPADVYRERADGSRSKR
jgi:hypothetical protein